MDQYLEMFLVESKEHLQSCNENLLKLEKNPEDLSIVNEIFRSAHTLKGMAATMGFEDMTNLTHKMENVFDGIRNEKIKFTSEILDIIFNAIDLLESIVDSISMGGDGKRDISQVISQLHMAETGTLSNAPLETAAASVTANTHITGLTAAYDEYERTIISQSIEQSFNIFEITVTLIESCMLKAARVFMVFDIVEKLGEVIKSFPAVEQLEGEQFDQQFTITCITKEEAEQIQKKLMNVSEVESVNIVSVTNELLNPELTQSPDHQQKEAAQKEDNKQDNQKADNSAPKVNNKVNMNKTIRVNIEKLDKLLNLFEELIIDKGRLEQLAKDASNSELTETVEKMSRVTSDLQSIILNMRMVPVESVFNRFPKMVRQLARDLNKKIDLQIVGQETELDRTVIDEIGDPLIHLLRNSVDHGIEMPDVRLKNGKPEEGTIILKAYHSGNHVFIEITDDGGGIDRDKVLAKAISKGLVPEESKSLLTDQQIYELIFKPGFSTADKISDISGRGVGLDVVKNTIESLGGSITVDSGKNKGSKFLIQLPLTLSIISAMLVEVSKEKYAIPINGIIENIILPKSRMDYAHEQPVIDFRGKVIPLLFLDEIFNISAADKNDENLSIVVVQKGDKQAGLVVNNFIGQQEIVIKSLGKYLSNVFAISGATILGDGQVALVVDCNELIN